MDALTEGDGVAAPAVLPRGLCTGSTSGTKSLCEGSPSPPARTTPPNPREWLCVLRKRTPRSRPEMTQQKEGRGPVSASDQAEPPWLPRVQTPGYGEEPKTDPGRSFDPGSSCSSVLVTRKQVPKRFLGECSYFGSRWPMKMQICGHHPVSSERSDQVCSFCPLIPAEGVCGPHCDSPRRSRSRHHFG